ncbi:signal transduction histidine kinase [Pseudonocardia hierapolitana]|uniref:histidine kinase n=1 Tax=Pseudonocardia hierapolitana TaxID=1128676 RepID=A0A561SZQ6_9PSEU|nr:sensor histidine kinase [Pseudonocardia hierapolitana]TWF80350.1 signal transduction histidine kinase [Pseudonocardia hierapolitana]
MRAGRPTRSDALLAIAVSCLVGAAVVTDAGPVGRAALAYAFAAGFGALVLASRRWPLWALAATAAGLVGYYLLDLPPIGLAVPVAAVLFAAADHGRPFAAAGIAAVLLLVSLAARLIEGDDVAYVVGLALGSDAVLMLAVIALGDAMRSRRALRAQMAGQAAAAAEERRREAARQVDIERIRIARELHDTLGHTMSVITLQSAVAAEAIDGGSTADVRGAVTAIGDAARSAMSELRATLGTWLGGPSTREPPPGLDRLRTLTDGVTRSGLPVDLHLTGDVSGVPSVVGTTAYRVVQEALTNALRHAAASRVTVSVRASATGLSLEVCDDGRGAPADEPAGHGHGLRGMTERVALLGGTVHAGNLDGGGFRVQAHLPLRRAAR